MAEPRKPLGELLASPWSWHRGLGLVVVAFFVWIAVTGMLLVHADDLGLARRPVQQQWILDLWGVPEPSVGSGHPTRIGWLAQVDGQLYLETDRASPQRGAVVPLAQVGALREVRTLGAEVYVVGSEGQAAYRADGELLETGHDLVPAAAAALAAAELPPDTRAAIGAAARSAALDWKRVVDDLHAWRPAGAPGKLLADLLALALIALSITGLQMWAQKRRARRAADG